MDSWDRVYLPLDLFYEGKYRIIDIPLFLAWRQVLFYDSTFVENIGQDLLYTATLY